MDDREYDIAFVETKLQNDELEQEWRLYKLGIRAEMQNALSIQKREMGVRGGWGDETPMED